MTRTIILIALAITLLPGLAAAEATTVYKKKNSDGTTTYSQMEVEGAEEREIANRDSADPGTAPAAAAEPKKSDVQVACENAGKNLELYDSGKRLVRPVEAGSQETVEMTPDEVAKGKADAQRQVAAFCEPAANTPAGE